MGREVLKATVILLTGFALSVSPLAADDQDTEETVLEQQRALHVEKSPAAAQTAVLSPEANSFFGAGDLLFVGIDNTAVSTYSIDPADNTTTPLFTGNSVWGAAMIPAASPGDAVVYISSGSTLYRWPANGAPELCCTLTYQAATTATVGVAWDPNAGELLFSKNISNEAIYSLPAVAANCPATCDLTLQRDYVDAAIDAGGITYDPNTDTLYAVSDTTPDNGIYIIEADASLTFVAPYPANQTDIDGLAYGNGKLYLVTDEPGDIYVFDIAGAVYGSPLANPWSSNELFSGAAFGSGLVPVALRQFVID